MNYVRSITPGLRFPFERIECFFADEIPHPLVVCYRYGGALTVVGVGYSSSDAATIDRSSQ